MRRIYQLLFITSCLILSSCTTKVAYNFLDWAVEWKIRGFVSLHGPQKQDMKVAVDRFHHWHRNTQLPEYALYLDQLAEQISRKTFSPNEIHEETDKVQLLLDQTIEQVLPDIRTLLAGLSDRQVAELLDNVEEERQEYAEEYVDISHKKQIRKRYKDFVEFFEPWVKSLNKEQKKQILHWSESLKPFEKLQLDQQALWQNQLKTTLENRHHPDALKNGLRELMFYRTDNWLPELQKIQDYNQALTYQLIADLVNQLSTKQKKHLISELQDYAKICRELAEED